MATWLHPWISARNHLDLRLRSFFHWPGPKTRVHLSADSEAALEVEEFLRQFEIEAYLKQFPPSLDRLVVADIGAKDFFLAQALNRIFTFRGSPPEVHGIEVDAHRRYRNLVTRYAVGTANANSIPAGVYHAMDFMKWARPIDVALLLNPFVSAEPLLTWGLPLSYLRPQALFEKIREVLSAKNGLLILSSPSIDEFRLAKKLARSAGFRLESEKRWYPHENSIQKRPRLGALLVRES